MNSKESFIIRTDIMEILRLLKKGKTNQNTDNPETLTEVLSLLNSVNNSIQKMSNVDEEILRSLIFINTEIKTNFNDKFNELIKEVRTNNNTFQEILNKLFKSPEKIHQSFLYDTETAPENPILPSIPDKNSPSQETQEEIDVYINSLKKQLEQVELTNISNKDTLSNNDVEKFIKVMNSNSELKEMNEIIKRIIVKLEEKTTQPEQQDDFFNQILKIQLIQSLGNSNLPYTAPLLQSLNLGLNPSFNTGNQQLIYNRLAQLKYNINRIQGTCCNKVDKLQSSLEKLIMIKNLI